MNPQYRVDQLDPITWRLSVGGDDGWRQVGTFGSEAAATAAISTLVTNSQWVAPPAKVYDSTGALIIITQPPLGV